MRVIWIGAMALAAVLAACATNTPPAEGRDDAATVEIGGREWTLVELDGRPVPSLGRGAPTLRLMEEGRAGGFTGCNHWFATVERSGSSLRFREVGSTRMACLEDAAMQTETAFVAALEATRSYEISGTTLTLRDGAGPVARFRAAR